MAAKSVYASNRALEYLLRTGVTIYVALFTVLPDINDSGGTEVSTSGTAYARKVCAFNAAAGGQCVNSADLIWAQATADWGAVAAFGLYDALTGGHQIYADPLPGGPVTISTGNGYGDQFCIPAGTLVVSEA
jgi:hypothetical protein